MSPSARQCILSALLLTCGPSAARGQYMYLDTTGDGIHTSADRLNGPGSPTTVDCWINTSHNRDGSQATCDTGNENLTINSYNLVLHAVGGTVAYGPFTNNQAGMTTQFGEAVDSTDYHNGFGGGTALPAGLYLIATVQVTVLTGNPSVQIVSSTPLGGSFFTGFGTFCSGIDQDNTYKLASDWFDADGAQAANDPPVLSVPVASSGAEGVAVSISATATDPEGGQITSLFATGFPLFLSLTGSAGSSPQTATVTGVPGFSDAGIYAITWSATDDGTPTATSTAQTTLTIEDVGQAPVITAPAAVSGSASSPISFDITFQDPDDEAIESIIATGMPPGATITRAPNGSQASFDWVPDPELSGTVTVGFVAINPGEVGQASTQITVSAPSGPRRPWVSPELRYLQAGSRTFDRLTTQTNDGQTVIETYLMGDISSEDLAALGVEVGSRMGSLMTARCPVSNLAALFDAPGLSAVVAPGVCQLLLDSSSVDIHVAGLRTQPPSYPLLGQVGDSVIVGIVDSGIDVHHADFRNPDLSTRLVSYWNQARNLAGHDPQSRDPGLYFGLNSGTEWTAFQIDNEEVNIWAEDSLGHGTHVAGIAAGNGTGGPNCESPVPGRLKYVGVAPQASLCVVKNREIRGKVGTVVETDIVKAVDYIFRTATSLGLPAVVNLSQGTHEGPHNGRSYLDYWMNRLSGPGKIVVAAAGNDATSGVHASVPVHLGPPQEVTLDIEAYLPNSNVNGDFIRVIGWFLDQDSVGIRVRTPESDEIRYSVPPDNFPPVSEGNSASGDTPYGAVSIAHGAASYPLPPDGSFTWYPYVPIVIVIDDRFGDEVGSGTWIIEITTFVAESGRPVDFYIEDAELGPEAP